MNRLLITCLLLPGCSAPVFDISDYTSHCVMVHPNQAALDYGWRPSPSASYENEIVRVQIFSVKDGYAIWIENLTDLTMSVNWRGCLLVDYKGWTHSVARPDLDYAPTFSPNAEKLRIAPRAKRAIVLIATAALQHGLARLGEGTGFRPQESTAKEFRERVIVSLEFKERELIYDCEFSFTRRNRSKNPELPSATAPASNGALSSP